MTQSYVCIQSRFGIESVQATQTVDTSEAHRNATMSLLLPGAVLHLNVHYTVTTTPPTSTSVLCWTSPFENSGLEDKYFST